MKKFGTLLACFLSLGLLSHGLTKPITTVPEAGKDAKDISPKRIERLVRQLGSSTFADREEAEKELVAIGMPAVAILRASARESEPEVSRRALAIVSRLETKAFTDSVLLPKKIKLSCKDLPVLDAVAELVKQSGYAVQFEGDRASLANRKITLETGEVTFYEALDQLCAKAGLVEQVRNDPVPVEMIRPIRIRPVRPGGLKIQPLPANPAPVPMPLQPMPKADVPAQPQGGVKAAPQLQVQIQIQPQLQPPLPPPVAIQPAQRVPFHPGVPNQNQGNAQPIVVKDGKPMTVPTSHAGAVRIRLLPASSANMQAQPGEVVLIFEVSAEPRLQVFRPQGAPNICRARDDQGQNLNLLEPPNGTPTMLGQRLISVRLKLGEKKAELLKELTGNILAEVEQPPEIVATIDNVLQAKGQNIKGKSNESLTLQNIDKTGDNGYRVEYSLENTVQMVGGGFKKGGWVVVNHGMSIHQGTPNLVDAQGKNYQVFQVQATKVQQVNGSLVRTFTVEYRADAGQGQPARLVMTEPRFTNIAVPFAFKDVPLP